MCAPVDIDFRDLLKILVPHHATTPVFSDDTFPFFPINKVGQPRRVLPTLVSYPNNYAFSMKGKVLGPGMLLNKLSNTWEEPSIWERERIMGFFAGDTVASHLYETRRYQLIGRSMDRHMISWIGGLLAALHSNIELAIPSLLDIPSSFPSSF